jgi:hypothetical protein
VEAWSWEQITLAAMAIAPLGELRTLFQIEDAVQFFPNAFTNRRDRADVSAHSPP